MPFIESFSKYSRDTSRRGMIIFIARCSLLQYAAKFMTCRKRDTMTRQIVIDLSLDLLYWPFFIIWRILNAYVSNVFRCAIYLCVNCLRVTTFFTGVWQCSDVYYRPEIKECAMKTTHRPSVSFGRYERRRRVDCLIKITVWYIFTRLPGELYPMINKMSYVRITNVTCKRPWVS